jgi:glycosyltransferase involved in cell wall biosynthesis
MLITAARHVNEVARDFDVILSIDRALPRPPSIPSVLMSNTLCYQTEVWAVLAGPWNRVIAPTRYFGTRLNAMVPELSVRVIPYGLPPSTLQQLTSMHPLERSAPPYVVRLPHRPDRRKGHVAAIEGLSRALPASRDTVLEIAWLDEGRYASYRLDLERLADLHGVRDQVAFTAWLDGDARRMAAARASATLLVGEFEESFGLAAVESVVSGRPVITCGQPAVSEVLGDSELHVQIEDPRDWYRHLRPFWSRVEGAATSRPASRALVDSLRLDRMAASYHDILSDADRSR